jgi:hypothetical protein
MFQDVVHTHSAVTHGKRLWTAMLATPNRGSFGGCLSRCLMSRSTPEANRVFTGVPHPFCPIVNMGRHSSILTDYSAASWDTGNILISLIWKNAIGVLQKKSKFLAVSALEKGKIQDIGHLTVHTPRRRGHVANILKAKTGSEEHLDTLCYPHRELRFLLQNPYWLWKST